MNAKRAAFFKAYLDVFSTVIKNQSSAAVLMVKLRCAVDRQLMKTECDMHEELATGMIAVLCSDHLLNVWVPTDYKIGDPAHLVSPVRDDLSPQLYGTICYDVDRHYPEGYVKATVWRSSGAMFGMGHMPDVIGE